MNMPRQMGAMRFSSSSNVRLRDSHRVDASAFPSKVVCSSRVFSRILRSSFASYSSQRRCRSSSSMIRFLSVCQRQFVPQALLKPADLGGDVGFRYAENLCDRVVAMSVQVQKHERAVELVEPLKKAV